MKSSILSLFLVASFHLEAQQKEIFYNYNWELSTPEEARFISVVKKKDGIWTRQDFYISTSQLQMSGTYKDEATKINHGKFQYFYPNGQLQAVGNYEDGKKTGTWIRYHVNGMMSDSVNYINEAEQGTRLSWHSNGFMSDSIRYELDNSGVEFSWFDNGRPSHAGRYGSGRKKTGSWKYFHKNEKLSSEEVYRDGHLISKKYFDESGLESKDTMNRDRDAEFPGGQKRWSRYLLSSLHFPNHLSLVNVQQVIVMVNWVVDEEGEVQDAYVSVPFHPDFDKIALKAIQNSPKWEPAISHNRRVKFYFRMPVMFVQR